MSVIYSYKNILLCSLLATLVAFTGSVQAQTTDPTAENMLVYQRSYGGWPKTIGKDKVDYSKSLNEDQIKQLKATADEKDGTIDNKATSREIVYLVKAYTQTKNESYLAAAKRGIDYLLKAQYENGGWPQFYPDNRFYRGQITFNDDAMINVMNILYDVAHLNDDYAVLGDEYAKKAGVAIDRGIACILKTQFVYKGKLTAWGAQYDEQKLMPAKARAFELPSLASSESANIVKFLMRIPKPSKEMQTAINSAIEWFDNTKITGYRADRIDAPNTEKGKDQVLVEDASSTIWARFYDLENMQPMFVGRDGIPKTKLADIDNERRAGYSWYGAWGAKLSKEYEKWKKQNGIN